MGQIVSSAVLVDNANRFNFHHIQVLQKQAGAVESTIEISNNNSVLEIAKSQPGSHDLLLIDYKSNPNQLDFGFPFLLAISSLSEVLFTFETDGGYIEHEKQQYLQLLGELLDEPGLTFKKLCFIRGHTAQHIAEKMLQLRLLDRDNADIDSLDDPDIEMIGDVYIEDNDVPQGQKVPKFRFSYSYQVPRSSHGSYIYAVVHQDQFSNEFAQLMQYCVYINPAVAPAAAPAPAPDVASVVDGSGSLASTELTQYDSKPDIKRTRSLKSLASNRSGRSLALTKSMSKKLLRLIKKTFLIRRSDDAASVHTSTTDFDNITILSDDPRDTTVGQGSSLENLADYFGLMTTNDGPKFRDNLRGLEAYLEELHPVMRAFLRLVTEYNSSLVSHSSLVRDFIEALNQLKIFLVSNNSQSDPVLNNSLSDVISKMHADSEYYDSYARLMAKSHAKLVKYINEEQEEVFAVQRKKYQEKNKDYYGWLNKYLLNDASLISKFMGGAPSPEEESRRLSFASRRSSMSRDPGDGKDVKYLRKKRSFELLRYDYYNYLNDYKAGEFNETLKLSMMRLLNELDMLNLNMKYKSRSVVQDEEIRKIEKSWNLLKALRDVKRTKIELLTHNEDLLKVLDGLTRDEIGENTPLTQPNHEGILWTYGGGNRHGWHKQWVVLKEGLLHEYADWKSGQKLRGQPIDLRFACIKLSTSQNDRRFCFEIITTTNIKRLFQAASEEDRDIWIKYLNLSLNLSLNNPADITPLSRVEIPEDTMFTNSGGHFDNGDGEENYLEIVKAADDSNSYCADCGSSKAVDWISISLLVVVCIDCSGVHRSLGSHLLKIRSLTLDVSIFTSEIVRLLHYVSNRQANLYWEKKVGSRQLSPTSSASERSQFIINKYKEKLYIEMDPKVNSHLIYGIHSNNIHLILKSLACGGNVNMVVIKGKSKEIESSLLEYALTHYSGLPSSPVFEIAELLLLNGANCGTSINNNLSLIEPAKVFWQAKIDRSLGISSSTPVQSFDDLSNNLDSPVTNGVSYKKEKRKKNNHNVANSVASYTYSDLNSGVRNSLSSQTSKKTFHSQIPMLFRNKKK